MNFVIKFSNIMLNSLRIVLLFTRINGLKKVERWLFHLHNDKMLVSPSVCLYVCLSDCLSVCLSVFLSELAEGNDGHMYHARRALWQEKTNIANLCRFGN